MQLFFRKVGFMAERSLRGMKIGTNSLESDIGVAFVERREEHYQCENGHDFMLSFTLGADAPQKWKCKCGAEADLISGEGTESEKKKKPVRTHWDMLLERRKAKELDALLKERLDLLRSGNFYQRHY